MQAVPVYLVTISGILWFSWEQHAHKGLVGVLQQLLMLRHHKVLVLVKEVVCLVAHPTSVMVYREACLRKLWL